MKKYISHNSVKPTLKDYIALFVAAVETLGIPLIVLIIILFIVAFFVTKKF